MIKNFLSKIYEKEDKPAYVSRTDLIAETLKMMSSLITSNTEKFKSPAEVEKSHENLAKILSGLANEKYDNSKSVYENIAKACEMIRKKKIIFLNHTRANILIEVLHDIQKILATKQLQYIHNIAAKLLYSASYLVYDIKLEPPNGKNLTDYFNELLNDYYAHNVLPKPVEIRYVNLKRDDEIAFSTFFDDILTRIERNTNNLIFIEGEHGVGKSYTAIALAYEIDRDFEMEKQLVYDVKEFIEVCNRFKRENLFGKVVVFDEIGASVSSMTSWEFENIIFDKYVQLFRYLRLTVIFTARDLSETIRRLRKRITHYIYLPEQRKAEIYKVKSKFDIQNDKLVISYEPYYYEDDYNKYLLKFIVPEVDKDTAKLYEEIRDKKVTSKYLEKLEEEIKLVTNEKLLSDMAKEFIEKYKDLEEAYIQKGRSKGRISTEFLCEKFGIGTQRARKLRAMIEKMLSKSEVTK